MAVLVLEQRLGLIIFFIPFRKLPEAFTEGDAGGEAEVAFEGGGVGISGGDVAGLHRDELLVGFEVVVGGENTGADEFFLEDLYEVQEVFGLAAADVIDGVGRDGQAVFAGFLFGGLGHNADDAFDDVIDVGEVPAAVAVVEDLDGLAFQEFVGKAEVGHVRSSGGAIDGEEAQAGGRDVVEFAVAMGEKFVALLRRGVEADGVVHPVFYAEGDLLVAAIDAGAAGIDQVLDALVGIPGRAGNDGVGRAGNDVIGMPAGFEDVVEADHIALDVGVGVLDAVAYAGLGGEVDDDVEVVLGKDFVDEGFVGEIAFDEGVLVLGMLLGFLGDYFQPVVFEAGVVVGVEVVEADDFDGFLAFEEPEDQVGADEAGGAGNENIFHLVAFENVAGVNFVGDVVEDTVVAVGDDGVGLGFEGVDVVDDAGAEEGGAVFESGLEDDDLGPFGLDAFHNALDGGLAEVVGAGFHREAEDADGYVAFLGGVEGAVGAVVASHFEDAVGDIVLARAVGVYDGFDQVLGDVVEVGEELFGVFREAVAAVAEGGVVVMGADARVEADAFDDGLGVEAFHFGVGVEFVEEAHS